MGGKAGLILVMGFSFIMGYMSLNLNRSATSSIDNMSRYNHTTSSHAVAAAGVNVGLAKLYGDTTWRGPMTQHESGVFPGSFTVRGTELPGQILLLQSISTYHVPGFKTYHDTIEVYLDRRRKNSFTLFAWMTNFEGNVFWITADTVWGRVHSNGNLHVNGRPVFWEKVTTAKGFNPKVGTGTNKAIFKQGYETGIAEIPFPTDLSELIDASTTGGRRYGTEVWLTLDPGTAADGDGRVLVRNAAAGPVVDTILLSDAAFSKKVILGDAKVHVQGTLDGKLSISSMTEVFVEDNILYETNPLITPSSNDLLGLIAEQNVKVADNPANNNHCIVHGSIFTRSGSFMAENYNSRPVAGELHILGSIVQQTRGIVAQFSGPTINHGFSKRYRYDTRLSDPNFRPPYYPGYYTRTLAIKNWWESYRVDALGVTN